MSEAAVFAAVFVVVSSAADFFGRFLGAFSVSTFGGATGLVVSAAVSRLAFGAARSAFFLGGLAVAFAAAGLTGGAGAAAALRTGAFRAAVFFGAVFAGAAFRAFFAGLAGVFRAGAFRVVVFRVDFAVDAVLVPDLARFFAGAFAAGVAFFVGFLGAAFLAAFLGAAFLPALELPEAFALPAVFREPPAFLRAPDFAAGAFALRFALRTVAFSFLVFPFTAFTPPRPMARLFAPAAFLRSGFSFLPFDPDPAFVFLAFAAMISSSAPGFRR